MRITYALCGLSMLVAFVASSPVPNQDAEPADLSPLNEVYLVEMEDDQAADGDRTDRDKRKIGVVKLGVSNGIINFIFGKLDSFLDAKTKALASLDDANRVKNAAYGIDAKHSATQKFIGELVSAKVHAASGSVGPVINSASTFLTNAKSGLVGALASKLAPLSSLSHGLSAGSVLKPEITPIPAHPGSSTADIIGNILNSKLSSLASLAHQTGSASSANSLSVDESSSGLSSVSLENASRGESTTEDIPEFDRKRVSLELPPQVFGGGFGLITNVSKILSGVILNSARRTQTLLEIFKPFFRGSFAIKGLPSDDPQ